MSAIDEWVERVQRRWGDTPPVGLGLRIVKRLRERRPEQLRLLTFETLRQAAEEPGLDADTLTQIAAILTSGPHAPLRWRFFFVEDSGEEVDLDPASLAQGRREGALVSPTTGELVEDFESRVIPYFEGTRDLSERVTR